MAAGRGQRCQACGKAAEELAEGGKMLCCGRCRAAFYCSADCQRADWRAGHKAACRAAAPAAPPAPNEALGGDVEKPEWGGPLRQGESLADRLARILAAPPDARRYGERFGKARELFRLGLQLFFERRLRGCAAALVEGLLLEDKALPQSLALAHLTDGPQSCVFGRIVEALREEAAAARAGAEAELQRALLEVQWLDMQMLFTRELCERAQAKADCSAAETHQQRWFDLLLSMDDLARKTTARHGASSAEAAAGGVDKRVLSRLTLVQAQYGANPPISRPSQECSRLARRAVELWPEDIMARTWSARREDFEALLGSTASSSTGLLEADAPQRRKLQERLQNLTA